VIVRPITNTNGPQLCDYGKVAGYGLAIWVSVTGPTAAPGAIYQYGTHAAALYDSQTRSSRVVPTANAPEGFFTPRVLANLPQYVEPAAPYVSRVSLETTTVNYQPIRPISASPQAYDFTLQSQVNIPVTPQGFISSQFTYGTHEKAIYDSTARGYVIATATAPTQTRALRALQSSPQNVDFTQQGFIPFVPVPTGFIINMAASAPQYFDFTLQAWLNPAAPTPLTQGPKIPRPIYSAPQVDPTQIAAQFYKPPQKTVAGVSPKIIYSSQIDPTQIAARVYAAVPSGPGRYVQPALISIPPQVYVDVPQGVVTMPLVGSLPTFVTLTGSAFSFSTGTIIPSITQLTGIFDYFTLAQALQDFSHRTDIGAYQDYYIQQAETRIYRDIFTQNIGNGVKWMEQLFTGFTTQGGGTNLPTGYLALKTMQVIDLFGNITTLLYKDAQWIYTNYPLRQQQQMPAYVARDGQEFIFGPAPDTVYTLEGTYYQQSPALTSTNPTTWMTTICPDLLLAACMIELQPFLKDSKAMKIWQQIYTDKMVSMVNLDQSERVSAGTMGIETG
jgi:hypothetical protein